MSQFLSLLSLAPVNPGGSVAPDGHIQMISSSRPYYLGTLATPAFSTLTGSSMVTRNAGVSTTFASSIAVNTLRVQNALTASTVIVSSSRITGRSSTFFMGGNVGIGSTQPSSLFDVNGTARVSSLQMAYLTAGHSGLASEGTNILHFHHNTQGPITNANLGGCFTLDGRNTTANPLFQWKYRPAAGTLTTVATMTSEGRLGLGKSTAATGMLDTETSSDLQIRFHRTSAGDLFGAGYQYSGTASNGFTADYVRVFGGTHGTIATSVATTNGYWAVDCAGQTDNFPSNGTPYASDFIVTTGRSWFTSSSVGIGTTAPATGASLHVNGIVKNTTPGWYGYNDMGSTYTAGQTVCYNVTGLNSNVNFSAASGRVTITIAGRYHVRFHGFSEYGYGDTIAYLYKNGAATDVRLRTGPNLYGSYSPDGEFQAILDLEVNDYVDVRVSQGGFHFNANMYFTGYMIG